MDVEKLLEEICGLTEDKEPKTAITLLLEMWNINGKDKKDVAYQSIFKPNIAIRRIGAYTHVDFIFDSPIDPDLKLMWTVFEEFSKLSENATEDSIELPVLGITLAPMILDGKYYTMGINPAFWALQPKKPGGNAEKISIAFENKDFLFYQTEDLDIGTIKAEAEREAEEKEQIILAAEIKAAKEIQDAQDALEREENKDKTVNDSYESKLNNHTYNE